MTTERWQERLSKERAKKIVRKAAVPAIVGIGILFPSATYASVDDVSKRSDEISHALDSKTSQVGLEVALLSGISFSVLGYKTGKKWDEKRMHALRVLGPALASMAAGTALLDSYATIDFAIPAGLALGASYAIGATTILSSIETTTDKSIRLSAIASGTCIAATGATLFLAAADKL